MGFTGVGVGWKIPTLEKPSPVGKGLRAGMGFFFLVQYTTADADAAFSLL
jgi:hypothetical protein